MEILQYVSIAIEAAIFLLGLAIALGQKRIYGWFIAITFGIYVYYDYAKLQGLDVLADQAVIIFFIATLSALVFVWKIYKQNN